MHECACFLQGAVKKPGWSTASGSVRCSVSRVLTLKLDRTRAAREIGSAVDRGPFRLLAPLLQPVEELAQLEVLFREIAGAPAERGGAGGQKRRRLER